MISYVFVYLLESDQNFLYQGQSHSTVGSDGSAVGRQTVGPCSEWRALDFLGWVPKPWCLENRIGPSLGEVITLEEGISL